MVILKFVAIILMACMQMQSGNSIALLQQKLNFLTSKLVVKNLSSFFSRFGESLYGNVKFAHGETQLEHISKLEGKIPRVFKT